MMDKINVLIDQNSKEQELLKKNEIKLLQAKNITGSTTKMIQGKNTI